MRAIRGNNRRRIAVFAGSTERCVPVELDPRATPEYAAYAAGLAERKGKLQETFAAKWSLPNRTQPPTNATELPTSA